jgi:hypothetical protein
MPDHAHVLMSVPEGIPLTAFVRDFKQRSGYELKQVTGEPAWQVSYYDHILRKEPRLAAGLKNLQLRFLLCAWHAGGRSASATRILDLNALRANLLPGRACLDRGRRVHASQARFQTPSSPPGSHMSSASFAVRSHVSRSTNPSDLPRHTKLPNGNLKNAKKFANNRTWPQSSWCARWSERREFGATRV